MAVLTDQNSSVADEQPDLQLDFKDANRILLQGIGMLPQKRRQAFALSRFEGKSHQEIATIMNIGKTTVAQYIMLSIDFLKSYLKKNS